MVSFDFNIYFYPYIAFGCHFEQSKTKVYDSDISLVLDVCANIQVPKILYLVLIHYREKCMSRNWSQMSCLRLSKAFLVDLPE